MATQSRSLARRAAWLVLFVAGGVAWWAMRTYLPTDGWGAAIRWVMAALVVLAFVGILVEAVVEFRRGYAGEDDPGSA